MNTIELLVEKSISAAAIAAATTPKSLQSSAIAAITKDYTELSFAAAARFSASAAAAAYYQSRHRLILLPSLAKRGKGWEWGISSFAFG